MGLRITTNVSAIDTHRQMVSVDKSLSRSLERLSSGLRINRASDDAAGNAIADRLSTQVLGGQEAQKNIQDAIHLLNLADGGANEMDAILQRMRTLAVQASNGVMTASDRSAANDEFAALQNEITNIASNTSFNGIHVFLGAAGSIVNSGPRSTSASTPLDSTSVGTSTGPIAIASLPLVGGNRVLTLPSAAETYGLGGGPPSSISITLTNPGPPPASMNVPVSGGISYNAATHQLLGNAASLPAGFTTVSVNYIPLGSITNIPLSGTPLPGSEKVTVNGTPVAGYTLAGNTVTLTGSSRPDATTVPQSIQVGYVTAGTTTLTLDTTNPFAGNGATSLNNLTFSVNGSPVTLTPADYTLNQTQIGQTGNTPLYAYTVTIQNTAIAAAGGTGQKTIQANYDVDYPTIVGPYQLTVQQGADYNQIQEVDLPGLTLGLIGLGSDDLTTQGTAMTAISDLDAAIEKVDTARSYYGAKTNGLEHSLASVAVNVQNQDAAKSVIRDVDIAAETVELSKQQILSGSATSVLKTSQNTVSTLLRLMS